MSDNTQFNTTAYKMTQVYLKIMLENGIRTGRSLADFSAFVSDKYSDTLSPYLQQFFADVSEGRIKIKGLS